MKSQHLTAIVTLLLTVTAIPATTVSAAEVEIKFSEAKKFSDYELTGHTRKKSLAVLEKEMKSMFTALSEKVIDGDHKLVVNVKNIDLPGNMRYGMGQTSHDIRVIDHATLFRLSFDYTLLNSAGETVKQGEHKLKEFTDAQRPQLPMRSRNSLAYFERPLKEWMKTALVE